MRAARPADQGVEPVRCHRESALHGSLVANPNDTTPELRAGTQIPSPGRPAGPPRTPPASAIADVTEFARDGYRNGMFVCVYEDDAMGQRFEAVDFWVE